MQLLPTLQATEPLLPCAAICCRYNNWGVFQPGDMPEPNNMLGSELCGVANYTEIMHSTGAWGWADVQCKMRNIFICKIMRE